MQHFKYLHQLQMAIPGNEFVDYIVGRVLSNDYRGFQCSQHNRLTYSYFSTLLSIIYKTAGGEKFGIHVGDAGTSQPWARLYYKIVEETRRTTGKGTINSIKKNTFPDIARMGFLERFDKEDLKLIEGEERKGVYSARLSEEGLRFVLADEFERMKLFTNGVDILTRQTASELVELLCYNDFGIDYITLSEYMYIFSDDRRGIYPTDKFKYLLEYRRLSHLEKGTVDSLLKAFCDPRNWAPNESKSAMRDYANWKNESQQIFGLLGYSTYFKIDNEKLILNTGNYGLFDQHTHRSSKAKNEYFRHHSVAKTGGFQLHHIVPFAKAQNKSEAKLIDDFRNLIYISDQRHLEFTGQGKDNVILSYNQNDSSVLFLDFKNDYIKMNFNTDVLMASEMLPTVKEYNKFLVRKFYYT